MDPELEGAVMNTAKLGRLASGWLSKSGQMPFYLIHSVTERCNARCSHCFVDKDQGKRELTIEEIEAFCDTLGRNLYHVCLSGGEPFLRADLADIARAYYERAGVEIIRISSNGLLTDRIARILEDILRLPSRRSLILELSIDGVGKTHDQIRKIDGLFDALVDTYRRASQLAARYRDFFVSVNVTVCRTNQGELREIYRYLRRELGVRHISMTLTRGAPDEPKERQVDIQKYEEFVDLVEGDLGSVSFPGYTHRLWGALVNAQNIIARRRIVATVKQPRYVSRCYAGTLAGVLLSDGLVTPCELRPETYGNVKEATLEELWSSAAAEQFREDARRCYCTHECFLVPSILFNPAYALQMAFIALRVLGRSALARLRGDRGAAAPEAA
jgi:Fe-coproporphyrin III synthase